MNDEKRSNGGAVLSSAELGVSVPALEDDEDPVPPRITDAPKAIWLNYGDLECDDTHWNCCRGGEVTWCEDKQFDSDVCYVREDVSELAGLRADAERYRRLAWLVAFGEWGVVKQVIKDSFGLTEDTFMDDKADMDKTLDSPEVVRAAAECEHALTPNKDATPANVGSAEGLGPDALAYARDRVSLLGAEEHIATINLALDALDGLPVAALLGGWTFKGFTAWAQGLEEQVALLNAEIESSKKV